MIRIQGPGDKDVAYREEPKNTVQVQFKVDGKIVYSEELDYTPSRKQMRDIFNSKVKPLYPNIELI